MTTSINSVYSLSKSEALSSGSQSYTGGSYVVTPVTPEYPSAWTEFSISSANNLDTNDLVLVDLLAGTYEFQYVSGGIKQTTTNKYNSQAGAVAAYPKSLYDNYEDLTAPVDGWTYGYGLAWSCGLGTTTEQACVDICATVVRTVKLNSNTTLTFFAVKGLNVVSMSGSCIIKYRRIS